MFPVRLFYHAHASGAWYDPVTEFFDALNAAEIPGPLTIGLTGDPDDRARAREIILACAAERQISFTAADEGFEQVTLKVLLQRAQQCKGEHAFLYCHAKGARDNTDLNAAWRRSMIRHLVSGWVQCLGLLGDGYDTVGCHWLTPEKDHAPPSHPVGSPFYGGNFWWARSSYLRQLEPCSEERRHDAEAWIGLGDPKAYDLNPGWPAMELFG